MLMKKTYHLILMACLSVCMSASLSVYGQEVGALFWQDYQAILTSTTQEGVYKSRYGDYYQNSADYQKMKNDKKVSEHFDKQNQLLAGLGKSTLETFTKNEKLAFWINAYNYFTLYDVKNYYPIKSMKDLGWKNKRFVVAGTKYSLDDIEHGIIRKLSVAEIHFAVNCASVSCPTIAREVFQADTLMPRMRELTKNAFRSPIHLQLEKKFLSNARVISVSKLLRWYKEDFGKDDGEVLNFIHKYAPPALRKVKDYKANLPYNWELNTKGNIAKYVDKLGKE